MAAGSMKSAGCRTCVAASFLGVASSVTWSLGHLVTWSLTSARSSSEDAPMRLSSDESVEEAISDVSAV
jgi:hypothetical protein